MDVNSMYPKILSRNTIMDKEDYYRYVLGIDYMKEVKEVGYHDYEDENRDVSFLYEEKKWNGKEIKNMDSSHIVNTLLMLERKANRYKTNYELFVIDHSNGTMLVPKDNINELININPLNWIKTTPIYEALYTELGNRGLINYYETVRTRFLDEEESGE